MSHDPIPLCPLKLSVQILSAYRDDALTAADAERMRAHLPTCPTCRHCLDAYETLARRARAVPMPAGLGERVVNPRLRPTTERRGSTRTQWPIRPGQRGRARPGERLRVVGPLAAALLLAVLASLLFRVLVTGSTAPVTHGPITIFSLASHTAPVGIVRGPDGNLWFTEADAGTLGRVTPAGAVSEFTLPNGAQSELGGIAVGPDGNLYFTEFGANQVGRITPAGTVTEVATLQANAAPLGIVAGPDGAMWFTETQRDVIGRLTLDGQLTEVAVDQEPARSGVANFPKSIALGPDGNLWFTLANDTHVGRITPGGVVTLFATSGVAQSDLAAGPDGALWFTVPAGNQIGRITPQGDVRLFQVPTIASTPSGITTGPDGNLWFLERASDQLARITPSGAITEFPLPAGTGPASITVGPDHALWITGQANSTILRYRLP